MTTMSDDHDLDPAFLAELDSENEFMESRRRGTRRLKLEKGESALLRLVPARLGPKKLWFNRQGWHWVNKQPYFCIRETSVNGGGNPDGNCEYCALLADLSRDRSEDVRKRAFQCSPIPQWTIFALLYEIIGADGNVKKTAKGNDFYKPYELPLYKDGFTELSIHFKKFLRRSNNALSILDPVHGCDVLFTKLNKGVRFDLEPARPFVDGDDQQIGDAMEKVVSGIETPSAQILDAEHMDAALAKMEDFCLRAPSRRDDRGSRDRDPRDEPRESSRRSTSYSREDRAPLDEDQVVSRRHSAVSATDPEDDLPGGEEDSPPPPLRRSNPTPTSTPARRTELPSAPRASAAAPPAAAQPRRTLPPPPASAARPATPRPVSPAPVEPPAVEPPEEIAGGGHAAGEPEEDDLPDEASDPAPPGLVTEDVTPAPASPAPARRSRLDENIRRSIERLDARKP